jgi:hypothetical protein
MVQFYKSAKKLDFLKISPTASSIHNIYGFLFDNSLARPALAAKEIITLQNWLDNLSL